jgi:FkbM family methyltransferase
MDWDLYGSVGMKMMLLKTRSQKWLAKLKWVVKEMFKKLTGQYSQSKPIHDPDSFLKMLSGVIHVGANMGQERDAYAKNNLDVVWVEPIPEIFKKLTDNLEGYSRQHAYQYLITDKDGEEYEFHISNYEGQSSSILELHQHKDVWPDVYFQRNIFLTSITLKAMVEKEKIEIEKYNALIMDTQGSELLVLKGAGDLLNKFQFIKLEVPDFESYQGCPQVTDIEEFLRPYGFREYSRNRFAVRSEGGSYYDILYKKSDSY